jgi:hypothetical protein
VSASQSQAEATSRKQGRTRDTTLAGRYLQPGPLLP